MPSAATDVWVKPSVQTHGHRRLCLPPLPAQPRSRHMPHHPAEPAMALFAVPIVGGVVGGAYLWGAYKLTLAVDAATRSALAPPEASSLSKPAAGTGQQHLGLLAASWAVTYAAGARALRPAFSRIAVPERVESAVQLAKSMAPGTARHALACTAAVAIAAAGTAAYDVRLAAQQQQAGRSRG